VRHILPIRVSIEKGNKKDVAYIQATMSDVDSFIIIVGYSLYSPKIMNRKHQPKKNKLTSPEFWRHPYGIKHIKLPSNEGASLASC
jgi:hypothetical protein